MVIGIGLTLFTEFTYFTKEKIVDFGGIEISKKLCLYKIHFPCENAI